VKARPREKIGNVRETNFFISWFLLLTNRIRSYPPLAEAVLVEL
jgi:hypothetical protein